MLMGENPAARPNAQRPGFMSGVFHLLDLPSQAIAVQRLLKGRSAEEKLEWLATHGTLSRVPIPPGLKPTYRFVSSIGMECLFFIDGDEFVFIGDHTTYTVKEGDPAC
jgi:hypothetical protein